MEISIEDVARHFAGTNALDGASLQVRSGELLALLGPSGSGKTTLLRAIAGLEPVDAGRILFDGEDATGLSVQERQAGFVFQHYALFRHMTVHDNVAFGLRVRRGARRWPGARIDARVQELLALVQLQGLGSRYPAQLSGGQRQRVALARALAIEPRVLLLDEPFGALDAQVRRELRRWLRELHEQTGLTTLFVTHDQEEALELADRVAILNRGRIEQVGTPDEVYDQPGTPFVYGFVGDVNRLQAQARDGQLWVGDVPLPLPEGADLSGPAQLYVRPEDLQPGSEGWPATVVSVLRSGSRQRMRARLREGSEVEVELPAGGPAWASGALVHLQPRRYRAFTD